MKKTKRILIGIAAVIAVILLAFFIYAGNYYHAGDKAGAALKSESLKVEELTKGTIAFVPEEPIAGLIFYPGGKVEHTAYAPLLEMCAERGILCVLVKMPFNLAVFDMKAADGIQEKYPEIHSWYIGGHSLGGAMAASYLADHTEQFDGLVLLAAYSTKDLSASDLKVLCAYGTEDRVMKRNNYEKYKKNLPEDFTTLIIDGGNHGNFGDYGFQKGDGMATLSAEEQWALTADEIQELIEK